MSSAISPVNPLSVWKQGRRQLWSADCLAVVRDRASRNVVPLRHLASTPVRVSAVVGGEPESSILRRGSR